MLKFIIIRLLELCRWNVADRFQQPAIIEPVDPFQGCIFDRFQVLPWSTWPDDFGFEQAIDRFSQGTIVESPTLPLLLKIVVCCAH